MNILLVNLGRHVSLYEQLLKSDIDLNSVYIAENDLSVASCIQNKIGSNIRISKALDEGFIKDLLLICAQKKIDYLFSFIDYGLDKLAKNSYRFLEFGTKVVVSPYKTIMLCRDKHAFSRYMEKSGISCMPSFLDDNITKFYNFPYFIKPRYGSASIGINIVNDVEGLKYYLNKGTYVVQPYMNDNEFGIDLLVKNNQIYDLFMKEKIAMRAGTTDRAKSVWNDDIFRLIERLVRVLDFDGPIDIDILQKGNAYFVSEVNPRFGGGYAVAISCGKNFFLRYINSLKNDNFFDYKTGVKTARYEKTIIVGER